MRSGLQIGTTNIIDYILYAIFFGIFLGLPNIGAEHLKNIGISSYHIISTNTIIAVLTYLYIIVGVNRQRFRELGNRYTIIFLLMLAAILVSGFNAYNVKSGLLYFRNYSSFYLLCILILWRLKSRADILRLFKVFFTGGAVFGVFVLLFSNISEIAAYLKTYQAGKDVVYRLNVLGINANTLGYIFAVLFIIKVSLLRKGSKLNVLLIAAGALDIYFILMTFSRGGFVILVVEVVIYLLLKYDFSRFCRYLLGIALPAYIIADKYFPTHLERFMTLRNLLPTEGEGDMSAKLAGALLERRVYDLGTSFEIGIRHFFWGVGGYNLNEFTEYGTHNQFLNMFVENGIITFVIYAMLVLVITIKLSAISLNFRNGLESGFDQNISVCLASVMCGSIVQGMVSYLRYDFWVLCGISMAWIAIEKRQAIAKKLLAAC
ncbi:MAG: O-antigen ligase family protein [Planctomycetota bacterium]